VHILSRADDVINVAGHRLSTSLLEQGNLTEADLQNWGQCGLTLCLCDTVISSHKLVTECCVVGEPDELK
jgi:propionyl-CoA synthetase